MKHSHSLTSWLRDQLQLDTGATGDALPGVGAIEALLFVSRTDLGEMTLDFNVWLRNSCSSRGMGGGLYFSFFVSWNQATEIYLPVKPEDCLYLVWIAVCSLAWTASRPPNFAPQRCSRRSRIMQGVGSVAVGVEVLQKGRAPSSQRGCDVEKRQFSASRCNPHLHVYSFHLP